MSEAVTALAVEGLEFAFPGGAPALRGVSFSIAEGERLAIIGPNGAGKSTLLWHLNGLLPETNRERSAGSVTVLGRRVSEAEAPWVRRRVGLLFQDPDDQLFCPTVAEDVGFGPTQLGLDPGEVEQRVARALAQVGLSGYERRIPQRLSSGEKKRVCLAGLLAYEPAILILDEPSAGLDPRGRREFMSFVAGLSCTCVIASHDLSLVAQLCSRTLLLDRGQVIASGPTLELLRDDALMHAHGMEQPRRDLPTWLLGVPDSGAR